MAPPCPAPMPSTHIGGRKGWRGWGCCLVSHSIFSSQFAQCTKAPSVNDSGISFSSFPHSPPEPLLPTHPTPFPHACLTIQYPLFSRDGTGWLSGRASQFACLNAIYTWFSVEFRPPLGRHSCVFIPYRRGRAHDKRAQETPCPFVPTRALILDTCSHLHWCKDLSAITEDWGYNNKN